MEYEKDWFRNLPEEAQIWQFVLSVPLSQEMEKGLQESMGNFFAEWSSHGKSNVGAFKTFFNQLVLVSGNCPGGVSGCSKDALHRAVFQFFQREGMQVFTGEKLVFLRSQKIELLDRKELPNAFAPEDLWLNTGLYKPQQFLKSKWLVSASTVF